MAVRVLLDGESVATATCMRSLTQFTVKLPWFRPLTGCACYSAIIVVKVCISDIDRCALSFVTRIVSLTKQ